MRAEAFIIHLTRARGRAPQVERLRESLSMPCSVIEAVDGKTLPEDEIARVYRRELYRPRYPFKLRNSEVACFLSHRLVWQTILDRRLDAGLVVEDDVEVERARFDDALDLALATMKSGDFVRFPKKVQGETGCDVARSPAVRLIAPRFPGLGMQAQVVGSVAARRLLAFTTVFDRPVDTMIQMHWLHDVRVLSAKPAGISEVAANLGGTSVQGKGKPLAEVLSREIRRPLYRLSAQVHNVLSSRMKLR